MSTSGMARKVDDLGRIVLPVEMRRLFGIRAGDALEIGVDDTGIVLRKLAASCVFCGGTEALRCHHDKQVCASCVEELEVSAGSRNFLPPAEPQGDVVDPPSGDA